MLRESTFQDRGKLRAGSARGEAACAALTPGTPACPGWEGIQDGHPLSRAAKARGRKAEETGVPSPQLPTPTVYKTPGGLHSTWSSVGQRHKGKRGVGADSCVRGNTNFPLGHRAHRERTVASHAVAPMG